MMRNSVMVAPSHILVLPDMASNTETSPGHSPIHGLNVEGPSYVRPALAVTLASNQLTCIGAVRCLANFVENSKSHTFRRLALERGLPCRPQRTKTGQTAWVAIGHNRS